MNMAENHRNAAPQRKRTLLIGYCNIPCQLGVSFLDIKYRKNMVIREWCNHCGPSPTSAWTIHVGSHVISMLFTFNGNRLLLHIGDME